MIAALRRLRMTAGRDRRDAFDAAVDRLGGADPDRPWQAVRGWSRLSPANRYERRHPGELVHIDIKKLGRIKDGAGKRFVGGGIRRTHNYARRTDAAGVRRLTVGWEYVHVCVDDATRLAYVEVLEDEKAVTAVAFLRRAIAHFAAYGIRVERVMTDNGSCYRGFVHPARLPKSRRQASPHTPLQTAHQWKSRTLHPHDARRLGLRRHLPPLRRAPPRPRWLARLLQSPTTTRQPQPPATATTARRPSPGTTLLGLTASGAGRASRRARSA